MKNLILTFTLSLFCFCSCFCQNSCDCYERLRDLAVYYYLQNDFTKAMEAEEEALSHKDSEALDKYEYSFLASISANLNDEPKAIAFLKKAIENGYSLEDLSNNESLKERLSDESLKSIEDDYSRLHTIYQQNINIDYLTAITFLKGSDQRIRTGIVFDTMPGYLFPLIDSLNFRNLQKLFKEYGFPNMVNHGFGFDITEVFFLHYSVESKTRLEEAIQVLKEANIPCYTNKKFIALLQDRYNVWNENSPQLFGLWNRWQDEGAFTNIKVDRHDERRFEYNLLRLKEQAVTEKRALPEGYLPSDYPANYFCGFDFKE